MGINLRRHGLNAAEAFRAAADFAQFHKEWPSFRDTLPHGNGHPVLVLPGFTAPDISTAPFRKALNEAGYKAYSWGGGTNLGLDDAKSERLHDRLLKIYAENGGRKITTLGLSLGGIFARELAREFPKEVGQSISVYSPFRAGLEEDAVPGFLKTAIQLTSGDDYSLKCDGMAERLATPPGTPTTSIYSKTDPIADWKSCLNPKAPNTENIEINGCHLGGLWSLPVARVIFDRLAQKEGEWKPYTGDQLRRHAPPPERDWKTTAAGQKNFFPKR